MSDDELDFDDPRFLIEAEKAAAPEATLTYAERRRRTIAKGEEKGRARFRSRKQQEEEAREEGLRRNLIAKDTEDAGQSKALKMMKGMGFKPGEGLGKRPASAVEDEPELGRSAGGGLGSKRRAASPAATTTEPAPELPKPLTEPLLFQMREGRTGLGVPSASQRTRPFPPSVLAAAAAANAASPLPSVSLYLDRNKGLFDERRANGVLRAVRRTCEELDRRSGIEDSVLWKAPEDAERLARVERMRRTYLRGDVGLEAEMGVDVEEERREEEGRRKLGALGYAKGLSKVVVEEEEEEEGPEKKSADELQEEADWLAEDAPSRLAFTLAYLRNKYFYCVWCGCQYSDAEDLAQDCPGEDEADH